MKRRLYIYQTSLEEELSLLFSGISDNMYVESMTDQYLVIVDQDYYNPEPLDIHAIQELIQDDFGSEVVVFVEPYMEEDFVLGPAIKDFLSQLPKGVHYLDDVITFAVLKNNESLKQRLKDYILKQTNQEVIHTVRQFIENNMNSSLSAKRLFMHRNTLNYRIDNFIESTHINVKTFKGANAIYMLYTF
jgi:hypothetical protein